MRAILRALDRLLRAVGDPIAELRGIGRRHREFLHAQVVRAAAGVLAKTSDALPPIGRAIRAADGLRASPRTRAHLEAADAWRSGEPLVAADRYAAIVAQWPDDLLALRCAQSCYFFLGRHDRTCAVVDEAAAAWPSRVRDRSRGYLLAMASFAHAENGNGELAEALGRRALAIEPTCPTGIHAVAHAIAESGRHAQGARWMRAQVAHWAGESRMRTHNAWHLAMFDADAGDVDSALGILDTWLLPASFASTLDACDAAALQRRLDLAGVDDRGRWRRISDAFERRATPGFWPYVDLHAALAHLRAGEHRRARRLEQAIARCARGTSHAAARARELTAPALRALRAWAGRRHCEASALLAALRPSLAAIGGSRVQLAIFDGIEREAALLGRTQGADPVVTR